jgi:hypothetical protein
MFNVYRNTESEKRLVIRSLRFAQDDSLKKLIASRG